MVAAHKKYGDLNKNRNLVLWLGISYESSQIIYK